MIQARGLYVIGEESKHGGKRWKGIKWKKWTVSIATGRTGNQKPPADVDALLSKYGSALKVGCFFYFRTNRDTESYSISCLYCYAFKAIVLISAFKYVFSYTDIFYKKENS